MVGALGAAVSVNTGERERSEEIAVPAGEGREVLEAHEEHGEAARNAGAAAALVAVAAAVWRRRVPGRILAVIAAVLALAAAREVVAAGKTGGELVYRHGVGLRF